MNHTSIENDDKNRTKVKTEDFLSLFNVDIHLPISFKGNAAQIITLLRGGYCIK